MTDRFTVSPFEFFVLQTRTRFPFRYGIASMTDVPHLFARTRVTTGARSAGALTSEGLPPKWFTKDPATTFEQDLPDMLDVITHAAALAEDIAREPVSFFQLWRELYRQQEAWAKSGRIPPLLSGLGVSLVERAVLDGLCRCVGEPLYRLIADNCLGVRLNEIYPELGTAEPRDFLPASPIDSCFVRHTIGLADALTPQDIRPEERVDDGLPQDLQSSIRAYGLRYFKVKLRGVPDEDFTRLRALVGILESETRGEFFVTVDGNENFHGFAEFRSFWEQVVREPALDGLRKRTLAVEQPVHRDRALDDDARRALTEWRDRPPLIIDESDGAVGDVPRALETGYTGASYKNCKGVVKGLANACLLAKRRTEDQRVVLTGEDLCTLGPIALQQDLAMMALLGIEHVERNGHHYYRGLSMLPAAWQDVAVGAHEDLYSEHPAGFARVQIANGAVRLGSVNRAPFGVGPLLDVNGFAPLENIRPARIS